MLLSAVIFCHPIENIILPAVTGNYIHGLFLNILQSMEKIDTKAIHDDLLANPFTVSPIFGEFEPLKNGQNSLSMDKKYWFRFSFLDPALANIFLQEIFSNKAREIVIADKKFIIDDIVIDSGQNDWSATSSYQTIYKKYLIEQKNILNKITLNFKTPTTFSIGKHNFILPLPELVFNHLLEKWNKYSDVPLDKTGFLAWIKENLVVCQYDLKTRMWDFKKFRYVGFVGTVSFLNIAKEDSVFSALINVLADFAFFSGIGAKTTMGMGMSRKIGE